MRASASLRPSPPALPLPRPNYSYSYSHSHSYSYSHSHTNLNPPTKLLPFPLFSKTPTILRQPQPPLLLPLKLLSSSFSKAAVVTGDSWEKSILKSDVPVLVEFYASWCGPCQMVHRVIDEIAGEYDGILQCFVLNTDVDLPIAEDYEIKAVPMVLIFKNGEKKESIVGTMPKEFYIAAIDRVLNL